MVRAKPYHAVHLEYLTIINLVRNVPSLTSFHVLICLHRHERLGKILLDRALMRAMVRVKRYGTQWI
jgi:hypothetical protein